MVLGIELCSADGLEVAFAVVGTGLALGLELGDGLVTAEGPELGAILLMGESLGVLLGIGLETAFTVVGRGLALGLELGDGLVTAEGPELGAILIIGESLHVLLGIELGSANGPETVLTIVGTGLALGLELGDVLVAAKGPELGPKLIMGESLGVLLGIELGSVDGLETAFTVVDSGLVVVFELGDGLVAVEGPELGAELIMGESLDVLLGIELG
jgi:hypothetical protein